MYSHIYTHIHMHTYIRMHIRAHTYTHTRIIESHLKCMRSRRWRRTCRRASQRVKHR